MENRVPPTIEQIPQAPPPVKDSAKFWKTIGIGMAIVSFCTAIAVGGYLYVASKNSSVQKACTMEAKLCPDGKTYVGRSGPKCEFAKCPISTSPKITSVSELPTTLQNYSRGQNVFGIAINYPNGWTIKYRKEDMSDLKTFKAKVRIYFDFIAPGNTDIQDGLFFDIYDPQIDIFHWIDKYSPYTTKDLTVSDIATIGSKPAFSLATNVSQYSATVVLGTNYSYNMYHTQGAGSQEEIGNVFYPMIHIE